jgi:hypothetical protein
MQDSARQYGYGFADFSAGYFFTRNAFGPYVGGGVSPRLQGSRASGIGFAPFAFLGAEFPRDSKARGLVEVRLAQNVLPIPKNSGLTALSDVDELGGRYPTEVSVQFGIVW